KPFPKLLIRLVLVIELRQLSRDRKRKLNRLRVLSFEKQRRRIAEVTFGKPEADRQLLRQRGQTLRWNHDLRALGQAQGFVFDDKWPDLRNGFEFSRFITQFGFALCAGKI